MPLSTSTLSLKFMQRKAPQAQDGAKKLVTLDKAKVVDEAEWHVGTDVRRAWGLDTDGAGSSSPSAAIVYESSYLPFLYGAQTEDDTDDEPEPKVQQSALRGRWDNLPKPEPKPQAPHPDVPPLPYSEASEPASPSHSTNTQLRPIHRTVLSTAKKGKRKVDDVDSSEPTPTVPARPSKSATASTFMRPAGVDAPAARLPSNASDSPKKKKKKKLHSSTPVSSTA